MLKPKCPGQDMRYWDPKLAVFEMKCPHCGAIMEFFKDEPKRRCGACGERTSNPRLNLGCAKWCQFAGECMGEMPEKTKGIASLCERLTAEMRTVFGDDERRVDHALAVLAHAEKIAGGVQGADGLIVRAAAILHDIGILEAERKHGSCEARYQEEEGPPIAREILERQGLEPDVIDQVCRIVGAHHSGRDNIDTPEFRVVWDADWLVNLPDEYPGADREKLERLISRLFKTARGRETAVRLFLAETIE